MLQKTASSRVRYVLLGILGVGLASGASFAGWQFWQPLRRERLIYQAMEKECHPVWKELDSGRITAGQDMDGVIARTSPVRVDRFENFVILNYQGGDDGGLCFTGVTLVGREGKLIDAEAWSCAWNRSFIQDWTTAEEQAFWSRYSAHQRKQSTGP